MAVEGNKNTALPLLAACLLTEDECVLTNVPRIGDVEVMARLLLDLGAEVDGIGSTTLRVGPLLSAAMHRTALSWEGFAVLFSCWVHYWPGSAGRTSRRLGATSRRDVRFQRILTRWPRWGPGKAWARTTSSKFLTG